MGFLVYDLIIRPRVLGIGQVNETSVLTVSSIPRGQKLITLGTSLVIGAGIAALIGTVLLIIGERQNVSDVVKSLRPITTKTISDCKSQIILDILPSYLTDLYKNRTIIQGDELAAAYIGKCIHVTGKVNDIIEGVMEK
jgi:hypothetical protein